ncbi:MAG: polyprenol monophosphomannose synthase [Candidatus Falkowbacteria bacterium]|nr:polyprenol monophosphomannose synthase [Candidatus Falkowbacteria bacterium]
MLFLQFLINLNKVSDCIVIIPTYNEKENIERIIRKVFSLERDFNILIIDDNSPDGTASIVKELAGNYENRLFLIERTGKLGLGTAYLAGFKWALENHYEYIFEMDADFSHNPDDLLKLHEVCLNHGVDLAIGSRYISGINVINWPLKRVLMSYFASVYVRKITGMQIMDTTAGFKCYRHIVLETINIDKIKMRGYGFQIEMKFKAWKHGFKIMEIPIIFTDRKEGTSKMSGGIFGEAFKGVIKMKFLSYFTNYHKKPAL